MRYAIFSDIHNNNDALEAVLTHAQAQHVDSYFCLGDIGVDNCVERARTVAAATVFGNWEVSNWRVLSPTNQKWVLNLPPMLKEPTFWLTHAGLFWPPELTNLSQLKANLHRFPHGLLFPYLHNESELLWQTLTTLAEAGIPLLFHGHTHRQLSWRFTADNHLERLSQHTLTLQPGETLIVGVGSVGSPLDGPGARYVIYDAKIGIVEMIRVSRDK
jgi:predicted phosphodiesterase